MARNSSVEYAQVAQACYTLFQQGDPVSFQRVYDLLGNKGSNKVVTDYISQWRKEAGDKLAITFTRHLPGLPEGLVATADELLIKFWQAALTQSERSYQVAMNELEQERTELRQEREKELEVNQARQETITRLEWELKATQTALSEKETNLQTIKEHQRELESQLREREDRLIEVREEVARLTATLSSVQKQHATDLASAQERAEEMLASARQQYQQEMAREREVAIGERNYLMQSTDEIRRAAKQIENQLSEEVDHLKTMNEAFRSQVYQVRDEAAMWKGRAESADALLARLTTRKQKRSTGSPGGDQAN